MRFLLDVNRPPAFADRLNAEDHDAVHVLAAGYGNLSDREIFERAAADKRVVVTFDLDFGDQRTSIILLRLKRTRQSYLWERLRVAITDAGDTLEAGAIVLVEDARIRIRRLQSEE